MKISQLIAKLQAEQRIHGDVKLEIVFGDYYGTPTQVQSYDLENQTFTVIDVEPAILSPQELDDMFDEFKNRPSVERDLIPQEILDDEKEEELQIDAQYEQYLRDDAVDSNGYVRTDTPWV